MSKLKPTTQLTNKTFKELEAEWYAILKKDGFEDIEYSSVSYYGGRIGTQLTERPLKEWHGHKFKSERSQIRQAEYIKYASQIGSFINDNSFHELCALMTKHGNSKIEAKDVATILELHIEGRSQRDIGHHLNRSQKCVFLTLKKAKEWMKIS